MHSTSSNTLHGWEPNLDLSRKQLRGFFLRKATENPVTNGYDELVHAPASHLRPRSLNLGLWLCDHARREPGKQ
jgi:hypothetical protein